jgi:prolyl-tRNA editing enzyme YbaK/EbsC (Cys-tRNA(Pro) deacylase)
VQECKNTGFCGHPEILSRQSVIEFFAAQRIDVPIVETAEPTPNVELAARAHGVVPGRIAKTLAFRLKDGQTVLLVARGDARVDGRKFKESIGKGRMLPAEEVAAVTGHPVGGVCPFGLAQPLPVFVDLRLREFDEVLPAAGSTHNAVRISPALLAELTGGQWVDVCELP